MKINPKTVSILVLFIFVMCGLVGCQGKQDTEGTAQQPAAENVIKIANQYGLSYAPLQIMQEKELIEKYLPGARVEWKQMGTGPVIREAMVSGDIDIGFMGISPFLIGWDKGIKWKIAVACGSQPYKLLTYKDEIKTIKDIGPEDKIATPAIASIQHILLSMAAERELGDAKAFDSRMISLTHPDAITAIKAKKDVTGHFATPPYVFLEMDDADIHEVIDGEEAFGGEFTGVFGIATEKFHDSNPAAYAAFLAAFNEAAAFINSHPEEAAAILAPLYEIDEATCLRYLTWEGTNYCSTPYGTMAFAEFMHKTGYLSKMPESLGAIAFENVEAAVGKRYGERSALEKLQYRDGK